MQFSDERVKPIPAVFRARHKLRFAHGRLDVVVEGLDAHLRQINIDLFRQAADANRADHLSLIDQWESAAPTYVTRIAEVGQRPTFIPRPPSDSGS